MQENKKNLDSMVPSEIVKNLDEYIVGQEEAKKTIAIAIRNRVRRKRLPEDIRDEVTPKNILMIGPTGVGKTEIARRIAKLANAPFIKVEATKYTEVGYVGRDVESMIRDLMAASVAMVREEMAAQRQEEVDRRVEERLLDLLLPAIEQSKGAEDVSVGETREKFRQMLRSGVFDEKEVEMPVDVKTHVGFELMGSSGNMDDLQNALSSLGSMFSSSGKKTRKLSIKRAREIIQEEELDKVIDPDKAVDEAKTRAEEMGIIFIDEIDKVASHNSTSNSDVSREGVQRDILPIVEGSKVSTKWGVIDTTNILFIAAGAFSFAKPSDLIPELQGRFPLRVELHDLTAEEFYRILTEPQNAITKQYKALLSTEGVTVNFSDEALHEIARIASDVNQTNDNIGARRLYTVMEKLLEELAFSADQLSGQTIDITKGYVQERLSDIAEDQDLSKYIL
ncbi:MAG: ATP-dependent protease ATPase subunit HslU [Spirochaetes bacterium]|uniref:ATP-dependent protease ATPase subunit HslU n=1 Tax=Candidatus Ornithospirochaeta stercoripullorum TaxID=2840899 RepID=A0A9D9H5V0_9SPIO|nr:ATP-dependent protease ATPase subunit HslU [Candidatus Ornithospirochaeta stercoripullorum]